MLSHVSPLIERLHILALSILIACLAGCSPGGFPTAPGPANEEVEVAGSNAPQTAPSAIQIPAGAGIAISRLPLTKPARIQTPLVREKRIGPRGGSLTILNGRTLVHFRVPRKALNGTELIRMEVIGEGPSVLVQFGPSGLHFQKDCTLSITFPTGDIDPKSLGGYLIEKNGKATPVPYTVQVRGNWITVKLSISHFSIYSPDDGEEDGAGDD